MSKTNRNAPRLAGGSEARYTFYDFDREFPDDAACLEWLVGHLYPDGIHCPKCGKVTKHHRIAKRPAFACQFCGHHEYPLSGTIFQDSATSLRLWFHGFYLMAQTRCGISAKQLERELGVTYKTAWRMFNKIRSLLDQDDEQLEGTVEADEAYWGGKSKWRNKGLPTGTGGGQVGKTPILGMAQRKTSKSPGKVVAKVLPHTTYGQIIGGVKARVLPQSTVYTDEYGSYDRLTQEGFRHERVHHKQKVYVDGDVHTNTIEGFWSLIRRGIGGTYHAVSTKHLQSYLDEYVFRYNNREANGRGMFDAFLSRIQKASVPS